MLNEKYHVINVFASDKTDSVLEPSCWNKSVYLVKSKDNIIPTLQWLS